MLIVLHEAIIRTTVAIVHRTLKIVAVDPFDICTHILFRTHNDITSITFIWIYIKFCNENFLSTV